MLCLISRLSQYGGHANKLKDLARITLRFTRPAMLVRALRGLPELGMTIVVFKNKYLNPTPMGYSDINLVISIRLGDGTAYLCEVQLNLQPMLDAKEEAHGHYEKIRKRLLADVKYAEETGDGTEFAIAVKAFAYHGGICSVWVYFGLIDTNLSK